MAKHVLVIIGEEIHAHLAASQFIHCGSLKIKPEGDRFIIDRSNGYGKSQESMRLINDDILKREVAILKKEKITRLFREEGASPRSMGIYARFRDTHDIKQLRSELKAEAQRIDAESKENGKNILLGLRAWAPIHNGIMQSFKKERQGFLPLLALNTVNIAYKAGVFDIVPIEDDMYFKEVGALFHAGVYLESVVNGIACSKEVANLGEKQRDVVVNKLRIEAKKLVKMIEKKILALDGMREKSMRKRIIEGYVPGSALICGLDHAGRLKEMLSNDFEVKTYTVGDRVLAKIRNDSEAR